MLVCKYKFNPNIVEGKTINLIPKLSTTIPYQIEDINNDDGTITRTLSCEDEDFNKITFIRFGSDLGNYVEGDEIALLEVLDINVSNLTSFYRMFRRCSNLTQLDASNWDTSRVTNMYAMFAYCSSLTQLDVSKWDTSKVTDMNSMFTMYSSLIQLDVSNWDTSKVTNMESVFNGCTSLTQLDVSNWDTSKVTNMNQMFYNCSKLTQLDVSNWGTSNVANMESVFNNCSRLTQLNVSNWDTSNVMNMSNMFRNCSNLTQLDLSNWDVDKVTTTNSMFNGCVRLIQLNVSNWNTSSLTNMGGTFCECQRLTSLNLSSFNVSKVTDFSYSFYNCNRLIELDISNWNSITSSNLGEAFFSCTSLRKVKAINTNFTQLLTQLPNKSASNPGIIFSYEEVPNNRNWNTYICKDYQVQVPLSQPLMKLGDVEDRLYWDAEKGHYCIEKKIRKVIFNGNEEWTGSNWNVSMTNCIRFDLILTGAIAENDKKLIICDKIEEVSLEYLESKNDPSWIDFEHICIAKWIATGGAEVVGVGLSILRSKLSTIDIEGFKQWLLENPITVFYQIATPEIIDLPQFNEPLKLYQRDNTTITIDSNIKPSKTTINYKDIQDYK